METSVKRAFLIDEKHIKRAGLQGAKLEELPQYVGSSEVRTNTMYFFCFVVPIFKRNEFHFGTAKMTFLHKTKNIHCNPTCIEEMDPYVDNFI